MPATQNAAAAARKSELRARAVKSASVFNSRRFRRPMIRALFFDFDGLILDTETALIEAYGDVHAEHGKAFDRVEFLRAVGHVDFSFDPWRAFAGATDADRAALETRRRECNERRTLAQPILPGVVALLDAGAAAGLTLAVVSNSSHGHVEGQLRRLGLHARFSFFACRGDAPSPKPEPDLYKLALARFGLRGPEAVAFEDSHTGSLAARRAHCRVVAVPGASTRHHDFSHADVRVDSLAHVVLAELVSRFDTP
ncbi:MAG: hypothetical protein RLZZ15_1959 [Verrucomicrobiota bacterium]|jgi:HAD superfamily hydrolase (TIGR01509 family)